jgi:hypothetical protein
MTYAYDPELSAAVELLPDLGIGDPVAARALLHIHGGGSSLIQEASVSQREAAEMFTVLSRGLNIAPPAAEKE